MQVKNINYWIVPAITTTLENIIIEKYNISLSQLKQKTRKKNIIQARYICFYFYQKQYNYSLSQIAFLFSQNHVTVYHGIKKVKNEIQVYKHFAEQVEQLQTKINNSLIKN